MEIYPVGQRATKRASQDRFTGTVWQDAILDRPGSSECRSVKVMFEPGARTAWHSHPRGQTLYVLSGSGLIGRRDAPPQVIRAGASVWIAPGEAHWHGAAPNSFMEHIAVHESEGGYVATWMEHVSDEDYLAEPDSPA
jgi:quercetin dioxygenase-like cupin family protein